MSFLRSLAWVIPLTILIWIYAEREQVQTETVRVLPIDVRTSAPNRLVTLLSPADKNIMVDLAGPRAQLDEVLSRMAKPERILIEIDSSLAPGREYPISTDRVADNPLFASRGITVFNCRPPLLSVRVDAIVERDMPVLAPPIANNLDAPVAFDPPTVRFRGPEPILRELEKQGKLGVYANLPSRSLQTPGAHDETGIALEFPINASEVTLTPNTVNASFKVKQAQDTLAYRSMVIFINAPYRFSDRYQVKLNGDPLIYNVTLIGPADTINAMRREDFKPKPIAILNITADDIQTPGTMRTRELKFDLPEGVRVAAEDAHKTVEFQIVEAK